MAQYAYQLGRIALLEHHGLSKLAGRMEAALRAGEITAKELFPSLKKAPKSIGAIRQRLAKPSRAPDLAALRKKRDLGMAGYVKNPGVERTEAHVMRAPSAQLQGSTMPVGGNTSQGAVHSRNAPTVVNGLPSALYDAAAVPLPIGRKSPKLLLTAQAPANQKYVLPSTLQHELAEAKTWRSAEKAKDINPFASHLGTEPLLAERLYATGDPQLQNYYDKLRKLHPEDKRVTQLMKEMGHTADRPMPIGGKQQRALDKRVRALKKQHQFSSGTVAKGYLYAQKGLSKELAYSGMRGAAQARNKAVLSRHVSRQGNTALKTLENVRSLEAAEEAYAKMLNKGKALTSAQEDLMYEKFKSQKLQPDHLQAMGNSFLKGNKSNALALAMNRGRPFRSAAEARVALKARRTEQVEAVRTMNGPEMNELSDKDIIDLLAFMS